MTNRHKLRQNENGFASIVIALVLIIILSLLTVGFAQLARTEQENALSKQLAVQAQDAAYSGINDAYKDIQSGAINTDNQNMNECMTATGSNSGTATLPRTAISANQTIDPNTGVGYTCLLVDLTPPNLVYSNVAVNQDEYTTFSTDVNNSAAGADAYTISWGSSDYHSTFPGSTNLGFMPFSTWNSSQYDYPGVLQVTMTPISDLNRSVLIANSYTFYLYPSSDSPTSNNIPTYGNSTDNGSVVPGSCNTTNNGTTYPCKVTIVGFSDSYTGSYLIHIVDYYDSSNIEVSGTSSGTPVDFINGQAVIDVTGKAKTVLKRLQVRVPINPDVNLPIYGIDAQNVCKRLETEPGTTTYGDPAIDGSPSPDPCSLGDVGLSPGSSE